MAIDVTKIACNGCSACASICPKDCISIEPDKEGFLYPRIDLTACVSCGLCGRVCPVLHKEEAGEFQGEAYACRNLDDAVRQESSSGGVFTPLAEWIIKQGGVVFGAAFDTDFSVRHQAVTTLDDLACLRGSKYLQSSAVGIFPQVKKLLEEGRMVLFSGTPCQIGGLLRYLNKDYETLYTVDIICHGVPSPMVWQRYKQEFETRHGGKLQKMSFRNKGNGWKNYFVWMDFGADGHYLKTHNQDWYMRVFLQNYSLRPSCYACAFKTLRRQSDITIADFWGIEGCLPALDDDKGTSFVLVHSKKGEQLFELIKPHLILEKADVAYAVRCNSAAVQSVACPPKREAFFKDIERLPMKKMMKKYGHDSMKIRVLRKSKAVLKFCLITPLRKLKRYC